MKIKTMKSMPWDSETFQVIDWTPTAKPVVDLKELRTKYPKNLVLQIDGGGIRGVIPSYHLYTLEMQLGASLSTAFNSLWGTSTGSIIVAMLNAGMSAKQVLEFYINDGPGVFKKNAFWGGGLWGSLYDNKKLLDVLNQYLGTTTFRQLYDKTGIELNLSVVDATRAVQEIWNYRTHPDDPVHVGVLASTSAPVFFDPLPYKSSNLVDGGTGMLNSTLSVAFDSMFYEQGIPLDQFYIVSFGTGRAKMGPMKTSKIDKFMWTFTFGREQSAILQEQEMQFIQKERGVNFFTRTQFDLPSKLSSMDNTDRICDMIDFCEGRFQE